jgi:hypothetical protein
LEKAGTSDWEDHETRKAVARVTIGGRMIHDRTSRKTKRLSVIACVSIAGESLTHEMMTSSDSASVRKRLSQQGVRVKAELFPDHIQIVF